jgi:hypothetical protein
VVPGKGVARFPPEPLPAFEPERGTAKFKGPTMRKEHAVIHPFHGHPVKNREKRRTAQLLVPVCARRITPANKQPVKERVIMVAHDRDQPELLCKIMDLHKHFLGVIAAVKDVAKVHHHVKFAKITGK